MPTGGYGGGITSGGGASGGLTEEQLRATPVTVVGTVTVEEPVTIDGVVSITGSVATTGALTNTELRSTPVPVSGTVNVGTVPVTGPVTDAQIRATPLPVSGTVSVGTVPVTGPLTDAQLRAAVVPVSLPAAAQVSLGTTSGKANQLKTGAITTVAITADQVVLTFTVTAGKTFYLQYLTLSASLTAIAAGAVVLGTMSLETPSGTKVLTERFTNPTTSAHTPITLSFNEPIPVAAGAVIRVVCTPAAVTSTLFRANLGGYEK